MVQVLFSTDCICLSLSGHRRQMTQQTGALNGKHTLLHKHVHTHNFILSSYCRPTINSHINPINPSCNFHPNTNSSPNPPKKSTWHYRHQEIVPSRSLVSKSVDKQDHTHKHRIDQCALTSVSDIDTGPKWISVCMCSVLLAVFQHTPITHITDLCSLTSNLSHI